jgi:hypothetical protein
VPSSLASLWPVSHLSWGSTLSPSPVLPSCALSLGCYLRFLPHAPAAMRPSPLLLLGSSGLVAGGVFAIFGAVTVGCTAWARVSILTEPRSGWECCLGASPITGWGSDQGQVAPWIRRLSVEVSANSQPVNMTAISRSQSHFEPGNLFDRLRSGAPRRLHWILSARRQVGDPSVRRGFSLLAWNAGLLV